MNKKSINDITNDNYIITAKLEFDNYVKFGSEADRKNYYYGGPKGMFIYCSGKLTNNGRISMTAKGAKAVGNINTGTYERTYKNYITGGYDDIWAEIYILGIANFYQPTIVLPSPNKNIIKAMTINEINVIFFIFLRAFFIRNFLSFIIYTFPF